MDGELLATLPLSHKSPLSLFSISSELATST